MKSRNPEVRSPLGTWEDIFESLLSAQVIQMVWKFVDKFAARFAPHAATPLLNCFNQPGNRFVLTTLPPIDGVFKRHLHFLPHK